MAISVPSTGSDLEQRLTVPRFQTIFRKFADRPDINQMLAGTAILWSYKVLCRRIDASLGPLDLTLPRFEVLGVLDSTEKGVMALRDLKRATLLTAATMTYTLDALEKRKLITRTLDATDRRVMIARITKDGRALVRRAHQLLESIRFGMHDVPDEDAAEIAVLLCNLHDSGDPAPDGGE